MKLRISHFAAAAIVATLSSVAACSDDESTGSSETGGTTTGGSTSNGTGGDGSGGDGAGGGTTATSSSSSTSAGTGGGGPTVPATFETIRAVVAQSGCADATCHNGEAKPTLQDDDALYETLTTYISEGCGNIPVVTPGKPEESALVKLVKGTCEGVERMPRGCNPAPGPENTCLPPAYIEAIEQWIADGAPQ